MFNKNWWFLNFQKEFLNFSFCIRKLAVAFYMINEIQPKIIKFQNIVQCPFNNNCVVFWGRPTAQMTSCGIMLQAMELPVETLEIDGMWCVCFLIIFLLKSTMLFHIIHHFKGVLIPWALFLKILCIFSKN